MTDMSCVSIKKNLQDRRRVQQNESNFSTCRSTANLCLLPFFRAGLRGCEVRSEAKHFQQAAREREADGGVRRLPAPTGQLEQGRRHHQGGQYHRDQTRARDQVRPPLDSSLCAAHMMPTLEPLERHQRHSGGTSSSCPSSADKLPHTEKLDTPSRAGRRQSSHTNHKHNRPVTTHPELLEGSAPSASLSSFTVVPTGFFKIKKTGEK